MPAWIKVMSAAERRAYFDAYIDEVVARYSGKLHSWDVVNEPFWPGHKAPGGFRLGPWYDAFGGTDYIRRAFERAAKADSKTKLVLNEAQTERDDEVGLFGLELVAGGLVGGRVCCWHYKSSPELQRKPDMALPLNTARAPTARVWPIRG